MSILDRIRTARARRLDHKSGPQLHLQLGAMVFFDDGKQAGWGSVQAMHPDRRSFGIRSLRLTAGTTWFDTHDLYPNERLLTDVEVLADLQLGSGIIIRSNTDAWITRGTLLGADIRAGHLHLGVHTAHGHDLTITKTDATRIYLATKETS